MHAEFIEADLGLRFHPVAQPMHTRVGIALLQAARRDKRTRPEHDDRGRVQPCHFSPGTTSSEK